MKWFVAIFVLLMSGFAGAEPASARADDRMDFGTEGLVFPPLVFTNPVTARTARLIGDAYQRQNPLVWKRVQYVAELGRTSRTEAAPFLIDAMKDLAPEVRAEAARSAAQIPDAPTLLAEVEKLVGDPDAAVRREAVLAAATIARSQKVSTSAIERGLSDAQPEVIAAALQAAWTKQDAHQIAQKLPSLPDALKAEAAQALARLKSPDQAPAVLPLLQADVVQRTAALKALGEMGNASQSDAVLKMLADPHPTVRREAVLAMGQLADETTRYARAMQILGDADPTVRQAAAIVLTPAPSIESLTPLAAQLEEDYAPLHEATRQALTHPRDTTVRQATIDLAAKMLANANPRRREDASYVLGHLHSGAGLDEHIALLRWDANDPKKSDWPMIAQAAESLGLIGDARALPALMELVKPAPDALRDMKRPQSDSMAQAMANALVSAGRLRHKPALPEAQRILQIDPGACPGNIRAAAAFAIGVLAEPGASGSPASKLLAVYNSPYESHPAKFEAVKAVGNLRHGSSADALKTISETDGTPDIRWIAHWAYERTANVHVPYTPPTEVREPAVSIMDLPQK